MRIWVWKTRFDATNKEMSISPTEPKWERLDREFFSGNAIGICAEWGAKIFPRIKTGAKPRSFTITAKEIK